MDAAIGVVDLLLLLPGFAGLAIGVRAQSQTWLRLVRSATIAGMALGSLYGLALALWSVHVPFVRAVGVSAILGAVEATALALLGKAAGLRDACLAAVLGLGLVAALSGRAAAQNAHGPQWTVDDDLADIVTRVPGFGGYWLEGSTLALGLVDTTRWAAALREFTRLHPGEKLTKVRVQPVKYDFAQLHAWKQLAFQYLGDSSGPFEATATGVDERHNRVSVWVRDSSDLAAARRTLEALGVPPDALELDVGEYVPLPLEQPLTKPSMQSTSRTDAKSPSGDTLR